MDKHGFAMARMACAALWTVSAGCRSVDDAGPDVAPQGARLVYGQDDRVDTAHAPGETATWASSTVALIPEVSLDMDDPAAIHLIGDSLQEALGVCADAAFADQPVVSTCSGVLIEEDVVLTAGHCVTPTDCAGARLVFDYATNADGDVPTLDSSQVFECAEVLARHNDGELDYALLRLDRPAAGRTPVPVRLGDRALQLGTALHVIGHPTGLPQKVADGASVADPRSDSLDYFTANLDVFPGSSGGPVFDTTSGELVGVVARGPDGGYVKRPGAECYEAERVADDYPTQIETTYVARAIDEYCGLRPDSSLCSCGNGTCEATLRETTASCAEDCGSACGDGVCNGRENAADCYADCGRCGNARCEPYEVAHMACCQDCGCPDGFSCDGRLCDARLGNLDEDGAVDDDDVQALRAQLELSCGSPVRDRQADVDCNGHVDADDLLHLEQVVAGESPLLPCQRVRKVAIGVRHACLLSGGQVLCQGDNAAGQLGVADRPALASAANSVAVPIPAVVVEIAAGSLHTCALTEAGEVYCWGDNGAGQSGPGAASASVRGPLPLPAAAQHIAAGAQHTCALMDGGGVHCWGDGAFGQLGVPGADVQGVDVPLPGPALRIAAGASHTCAVLAGGELRCWGRNVSGQLGLGHTRSIGDDEPVDSATPVDIGGQAVDVVAHWNQTCAERHDGAFVCFGDNLFGQLGVPVKPAVGDDETPAMVGPVPLGTGATSLALGQGHTCAGYADGSLRCWGLGLSGQLGRGQTAPPPPPPAPFTLAIGPDHGVPPPPSPGGPLPPPPPPGGDDGQTTPAELDPVPLGDDVAYVAAGAQMTCATTPDGSVYCFGANFSGQLGYALRDNVGDDETPASVGPLPLHQTPALGWHVEDACGVDLSLAQLTGPRGSMVALRVERRPERAAALTAHYGFATPPDVAARLRGGGGRVGLVSHATPGLHTLVFEVPGRDQAGPVYRGRARITQGSDTWDPEDDYGAGAARFQVTTAPTRLQVTGPDDAVCYGQTRPVFQP